jgi:predicted dienelactone hydrolase
MTAANALLRRRTRWLLLPGLTLAVAVAVSGPVPSYASVVEAATATALRLTLPPPTGNHRIGVLPLHLVDRDRPDPWVAAPTRELMVSLWYPAQPAPGQPVFPWLTPSAWDQFGRDNGIAPGSLLVPLTHGTLDAPVDAKRGGRPLVLFSPGFGGNRDSSTLLVEQLVSRGYVVATIDHTYDAREVEFPDGRVEVPAIPPFTPDVGAKVVAVRAADTRFVLDSLLELNAGGNPDAEGRPLPAGMPGLLDPARVGMFGHSIGGATAAQSMYEDRRIRAGINLDGTMYGPVVQRGLNRPFMLVASNDHSRHDDPSWEQFWADLRGWRLDLRLMNAGHDSFTDQQVLLPQLNLPLEAVQQLIGTIDPHRSVVDQRAYVTAFFDQHVSDRHRHLLDGPSARFPEVQYLP